MKSNSHYLRIIPLSVFMGVIFFLSHQPGSAIHLPPVPEIDKVLHGLAYGVLAGTAIFAVQPKTRQRKSRFVGLMVVLFCLLYGISDEFHQSFIPGRDSSAADLVADVTGALIAVSLWYGFSGTRKAAKVRLKTIVKN